MTDITKVEQQVATLEREAQSTLAAATECKIASPADYEGAAADLQQIKARLKELDAREKEITKPMNAALKSVRDLFRRPKAVYEQAETAIKRALGNWDAEQRRKAAAEQARLEEQARKERERLDARAQKAAEAGKDEKAAELSNRAAMTVAPTATVQTPKVEGLAFVEVWKFAVIDASQVPDAYKLVDEKKVGQVVRAMKGATDIPGVRVWSERQARSASAH